MSRDVVGRMAMFVFDIGIVSYALSQQQFAIACVFSGFVGALVVTLLVDVMEHI